MPSGLGPQVNLPEIEFVPARTLLEALKEFPNTSGLFDGDALMRALQRETAVTQELPAVSKPSWSLASHNTLCFAINRLREFGTDEDSIEDLIHGLASVDESDIDEILMALEKVKQVLSAIASDCLMGRILAQRSQ